MNDTGVIDNFLNIFTGYIDSGFGLLGGEVAFLSTTLIAIDVTLAGLFWAWGADEDVLQRLVKKTLFVGAFAYIIGNWNALARIVFESFAGLGLKASGTGFSAADLLQPGRVAQVGLDGIENTLGLKRNFATCAVSGKNPNPIISHGFRQGQPLHERAPFQRRRLGFTTLTNTAVGGTMTLMTSGAVC